MTEICTHTPWTTVCLM